MRVKICGITHPDDAVHAAKSGAEYIGIVLAPGYRRSVSLAQAKEITTAACLHGAIPVCAFVDESAEQILEICGATNVKVVELHGTGSRAAFDLIKNTLTVIYVASGTESRSQSSPACPQAVLSGSPERFGDKKSHFVLYDSSPGSGKSFNWEGFAPPTHAKWFLAGGLTPHNVATGIRLLKPYGVSVSSGVEATGSTRKDPTLVTAFIQAAKGVMHPHPFGGQFLPEILMTPLLDLQQRWKELRKNPDFREELDDLLRQYAGRPTPLTEIQRFAAAVGGPRIFLKREDLLHTGAHKINNALGQCLLAKQLGKKRILAETGAGQHGVATATACARLGLECIIYMGSTDMARQQPNVERMQLLGATVVPVHHGAATLKDAINEALRDWAANYETSHYCLGSALGPSPYPEMVREFQSVISLEVKEQLKEYTERNPDMLVACVGGGSNAIGFFHHYIEQAEVKLVGVEAGGLGVPTGQHAARFEGGRPGVLHGCYTYLLQDDNGQVLPTHSVSAGLDYPAVGPDHSCLYESQRASYVSVTDDEALAAFHLLTKSEGIIPALESSHALAYVAKVALQLSRDSIVLINLSGRGDKDLTQILAMEKTQ